jgi:hypothetical protein
MYAHRWKWIVGCMLAVPVTLIGCGGKGEGPESDAGVVDGGGADGSACPMAEALWTDVDLATFTPLVELEALDVADDVMLAEATTYWELRRASTSGDIYEVVLNAGDKCAEADDVSLCSQEFDDLSATSGFGPSCLPGDCVQYIAVNRGNTNQLLTSPEELVAFLGNIDTPTEAALVAYSHRYGWDITSEPRGAAGGVRATADGYELLVTELTQDCDPVVTDRVQLTVSTAGEATVVRRQVYSALCGACI